MKNLTTHILRDGDRTVIVIEGSNVHQRDMLAYYIAQAYQMPDEMARQAEAQYCKATPAEDRTTEIQDVEGLEPTPYKPPEISHNQMAKMQEYTPDAITITGGEYQGQAPDKAVQADGIKAVVVLRKYLKQQHGKISAEEEKAIIAACKSYLQRAPEEIQHLKNKAQMGAWITYCGQLMDTQQVIYETAGYQHPETLLANAPDNTISEVVKILADQLQKRGNR